MFKGIIDKVFGLIQPQESQNDLPEHEFCPNCEANLTKQKGYDNTLPYWVCLGCGEMLINPDVDSDIAWICDQCGSMLNIQKGFREDCGEWKCTECGFVNQINNQELYVSEDEHEEALKNPYRGLSDEEVIELSMYVDEETIGGRNDIILVRDVETNKLYVKKLLTTYEKSIYSYLRDNPIKHMPQIVNIYESANCLVVIEEYIQGETIASILGNGLLKEDKAISVAKKICVILDEIHNLPRPIIHRDIKPSNVIVTPDDEVYLLDVNVAKWYEPGQNDDTRYMGTQNYAAPEQVGYGLSASTAKTDIYALGMLLNVMITGKFPKEEHVQGDLWKVIEKCISLEAERRYTARELLATLEGIGDEV